MAVLRTCGLFFTDGVAWSVCLSVTIVSAAKTAEAIEMLFGMWTRVDLNHALDGGALWRHPANTIELSKCGGDAALCQITLSTCY